MYAHFITLCRKAVDQELERRGYVEDIKDRLSIYNISIKKKQCADLDLFSRIEFTDQAMVIHVNYLPQQAERFSFKIPYSQLQDILNPTGPLREFVKF